MRPSRALPKSRKRKWFRRALFSAALLLTAALATPFLFATPMVRYYVAHSAYRDMPITFGAATLSPLGRLTLYDVEVQSAGARVGGAQRVELDFSWTGVFSRRFQSISLENIDVSLHPGQNSPLNLMDLSPALARFRPPSARVIPPSTAPAPAASVPPPTDAAPVVWCDQIIVTGHVRLEGYNPWLPLIQVRDNDPLPVQAVVKTTGTAASPVHDVSLIVGEPGSGAGPFLTTRFTVQTTGDATKLNVEQFNLGHVSPAVSEAILEEWPGLPAGLRRIVAGRLDRVILSGSASFGREITVNATAELRDFSARAPGVPTGAAAPLAGVPEVAVEHLSAGLHVEGRVTGTPLKDLKFSGMHCTWEGLQAGTWRWQKGGAEFQVDGPEIVMSDMQTTCEDAEVIAMGAWDTQKGVLSRGRVWLNGFSAQTLRARLPAPMRALLPEAFDGTLSARIFLGESESDHVAALVEVVCPDDLTFNLPVPAVPAPATGSAPGTASTTAPVSAGAASAATTPAVATGTAPSNGAAPPIHMAFLPGAVLSNAVLSGTVSWNYRPDSWPEVTHGRLTADELFVMPPHSTGGLDGTALDRIKSDFTISGGNARLDDFYADLPGNGRLSVEGTYTFEDQSLDDAIVSLNGVDLALANVWLPAGWSLTGQADAECQGARLPRASSLAVSLGLSPQVTLKGPEGQLTVLGAPPELNLKLARDRVEGTTQIQTAEVSGLGAIQGDAGLVKMLRRAVNPAAGSIGAQLFDRLAGGAFVSLDRLSFTGHAGPADAGGTLSCIGLDVGAGAGTGAAEGAADTDPPPALTNLTLKADLGVPLSANLRPNLAALRVTGGQFLVEKLALGQNVFGEISGNVTADNGQIAITRAALSAAEGTIKGDATIGFDGVLGALYLDFSGLHQQVLFRNLYPDVFTAAGPISGHLILERTGKGPLHGAIEATADQAGRLRISRPAAQAAFAPAARAAGAPDAALPENFDAIVADQLGDFAYMGGKASLVDEGTGAVLKLDYARAPLAPGDPGYGVPVNVAGRQVQANVEFELRGGGVRVPQSVAELVGRYLGLREAARATQPGLP